MARPIETSGGGSGVAVDTAIALATSRADAFDRAARHSRRVRFLKRALPLAAIVLAALFGGYTYLAAPPSIQVKAEGAAFSEGKLVMAKPQLSGFTRDNLPYSMTADRAVQDPANQGVVELLGIDANLPISADNIAKVDAVRGIYDREGNTLNLTEQVIVKTSDGMVAKLKSAYLDMGSGAMKSDEPVEISLDGSKITSDSMSMLENGKVVVFEKKVRVDIDPARMKAAQNGSGGGSAAK
ncbi:LPS export ABC transporter periplasmic protein LptC [Aminobacter carboxidus]|uniref:LPS export ABC transporter periplasmic protein LptC n=1 Tax=Aminobacter carboxidus TaxID=376165 RepID=A0ABR9GS08_9HYPH|nr:LPS export ABC transporter periplasmic protein LptC [Aminobacter carboxidus]MBE1206344.1 LPS export ABC transporter periplasmic protein LptC [Aminobacter carboxidus]